MGADAKRLVHVDQRVVVVVVALDDDVLNVARELVTGRDLKDRQERRWCKARALAHASKRSSNATHSCKELVGRVARVAVP